MNPNRNSFLRHSCEPTLDVIPAYTWYADSSGALTFVNKRHADYLGLPKDHPLRFGVDVGAEWDSHLPLVHPDDHAEMRRAWSDTLRTGCAGEVSFRARNAEGGYRWFLSRVEPLRTSDGSLLYWIGVTLDIDDAKQAENALRKSEKELRDAIDTIPALVWSALPDGSNTYANKRFVEYLGLSAEHTAGSRWHALIHPDDLERHASKWMQAVATGKPHENESRYRRSDGQYRWHLDRGLPLRDKDGNIVKWYGVTTDIEDRKCAEQALRRSEAYLAEAQRLSQTGSFGWRPDSGKIVWSDETYRIFEYDRAVKPTIDLAAQRVHPDDLPEFVKVIESASAGATQFEHTYRLLLPDGSVKHVHALAHALQDASGNREFVGAATDVTSIKRAEEELRRSEMELRQILDLVPQIVSVYGAGGERLYANRIGLDYVGLSLEEWRQRPASIFSSSSFFHPDDRERAARAYSDSVRSGGSAYELEARLRKHDATYRWFLVRVNPLRDEQGQVTRWYVALTDIEDRKRVEERLQQENAALREEIDETSMFEEIVGTSPALRTALLRLSKVAPTDSTVLITGETGTGKELVARAIHKRSQRSGRAFVSVNCAAIPRDLILSELFGHEKGAFTGATQRRLGRFEMADGGTIFLDEVGELSPETQVALLRVLQEREFERVGGGKSIRVDVRLIAATNRDLKSAAVNGAFRHDLFYRLNVFPIEMPPLRKRKDDILMLVEYFVQRYAARAGKHIRSIDKRTLDLLKSYDWPGNIRELQNVVERALILGETDAFVVDERWLERESAESSQQEGLSTLAGREVELIEAALAETHGRISGPRGAAAKLGIPRQTLESKIRRLGINKYGRKQRAFK
jgi:PAS domain S-box-containing protein